MKFLPTLLFTVFAGGVVLAAPPQSHRPDRYKDLYLDSMFTDPPPPEEEDPVVNDLPDWVLVGVSKYVGRVEVEVMNIKDRTRVRIPGKDATEMGFAIKEVKQGGNYIDDTVVVLEKGNNRGEVRFDTKFLVLKKVAGPSIAKGKQQGNPSGKKDSDKGRSSRDDKPPVPGSRPGGTTNGRSTPPRPGTTTSSVPRPGTASTTTTDSTSKKRSRWISPKK